MPDPDQDWKRWLLGALLPVIALFEGVGGLMRKTAVIYGRPGSWTEYGKNAVPVSLCYIFGAVFCHVYFFWENRERFAGYREIMAIISLVAFLASGAYFAYLDFRP